MSLLHNQTHTSPSLNLSLDLDFVLGRASRRRSSWVFAGDHTNTSTSPPSTTHDCTPLLPSSPSSGQQPNLHKTPLPDHLKIIAHHRLPVPALHTTTTTLPSTTWMNLFSFSFQQHTVATTR